MVTVAKALNLLNLLVFVLAANQASTNNLQQWSNSLNIYHLSFTEKLLEKLINDKCSMIYVINVSRTGSVYVRLSDRIFYVLSDADRVLRVLLSSMPDEDRR